MVHLSLKQCVNNVLLQKGYSLHWYLQCLVYAKDVLRELTFDDLHVVNTKLLTVNSYNAVELPDDYQDWTSVNIRVGQKLHPLVEDNNLDPLYNYDSNFQVEPYVSFSQDVPIYYQNAIVPVFWRTTTFNEYGENTGRLFGIGAGNPTDTFRIIKTRNEIQLNENIAVDKIVLCYISNGQSVDAATTIDAYAQKTIETYILWQLKEHNRSYSEGEKERAKQEYIAQRKILRARMSDLTINKLKRLVQKNSQASPKT